MLVEGVVENKGGEVPELSLIRKSPPRIIPLYAALLPENTPHRYSFPKNTPIYLPHCVRLPAVLEEHILSETSRQTTPEPLGG